MIDYRQLFRYWVEERHRIKVLKDAGHTKPWSSDPVFQNTYFCNVHREDDRVTRWIRRELSPAEVGLRNYEFVMIMARFLNWPNTLGYLKDEAIIQARPDGGESEFAREWCRILQERLEGRMMLGEKVWGNAYVITSHGMKMSKIEYLCDHLLPDALRALPALRYAAGEPLEAVLRPGVPSFVYPSGVVPGTCEAVYKSLQTVPGIGSFLAAQVVADLKNTKEHELYVAPDKSDFVAHGPGSVRGLSWYFYGSAEGVTERTFYVHFDIFRRDFDEQYDWGCFDQFSRPDNQDLQNCLCEFDKYCRVKNGTGRSKRQYPGV